MVAEQLLGCIAESVTTDEEREREREIKRDSGDRLDAHFFFHSVDHDKNPPLCTKGGG